jgi:hypothetical protein
MQKKKHKKKKKKEESYLNVVVSFPDPEKRNKIKNYVK